MYLDGLHICLAHLMQYKHEKCFHLHVSTDALLKHFCEQETCCSRCIDVLFQCGYYGLDQIVHIDFSLLFNFEQCSKAF